ncbi:SRPBCC family protein [Phormidium sp. FACHB-1136]|jgi:ribosome-associated toxin RatA of RatAB toxin-antitoxin module|uniref:SRPBCC family protein n=1 Tax=Phormidium sp. FACHB-1136 TaxID=2692848 RepID=UPI001688D677|nr:SRPBCC family protein [Phormidium sp. FACHB-1136]MBD2424404.1 SRPBCC family protein [Phormidium sp. FACHB-1136]
MSLLSRQVLPAETYLARLSTADWAKLSRREVLLWGGQGQYEVMATTTADWATAWAVLTDYGNFARFLPTVAKSQVIEADGPRTIVEQVDRRRILLSTLESVVRTENLEISQQQISFRLVQGNLKHMYGHWRLDEATPPTRASPLRLVSQQVHAEADVGPFKAMFYTLFESSLVETIQAIRQEMERRHRITPGSR